MSKTHRQLEAPNSSTRTKVNSYTQVDPKLVGTETRCIEEENQLDEYNLPNRLQYLSLKEHSSWIRPPLIGQASSSSNDSVSLPLNKGLETLDFERNVLSNQQDCSQTSSDPSNDMYITGVKFKKNSFPSMPCLDNSNEYINQQPPEGSLDQISPGLLNQPLENYRDFPKIRSSSSASSVTSSRPLEWDSGADVGYNPINVVTGTERIDSRVSNTNTEYIALMSQANFLPRSDPEGTTYTSNQSQSALSNGLITSKVKDKNTLGTPNAESTPVHSVDMASYNSVAKKDIGLTTISPINYVKEKPQRTKRSSCNSDLYGCNISDERNCGNQVGLIVLPAKNNKLSQSKVPLFPGINDFPLQVSLQHKKLEDFISSQNPARPTSACKKVNVNYKTNKKSSSLEDVDKLCSLPQNIRPIEWLNTIPRRQSQLHQPNELQTIKKNYVHIDNVLKYSMALHSLDHYNKSTSSMSVATVVVQREGASRHKITQTSILNQESNGIEVCNVEDNLYQPKPFTQSFFSENPHLLQPIHTQPVHFGSSHVNFSSEDEGVVSLPKNYHIPLQHTTMPTGKNTICNNPTIHCSNGVGLLCTGAHKKIQQNTQNKQKQEDHTRRSSICVETSNLCSRNKNSKNQVQNVRHCPNSNFSGTVKSAESSVKSGGCWTDKEESVTVEDRVNSFEYLPGHIYENSERQQPIDSRETSSTSIENQTSSIETLNDDGKILDSCSTSTGMASSLERDVQRGVNIISDFIKGSCSHDSVLKKKIIKRIVETLINKHYNEKMEVSNLLKNAPWVPLMPSSPIEKNGRKTRRSLDRSKVPCEFSSRSEKSGSTNASSECFIPFPSTKSTFQPSSLRGISFCKTDQGSYSSTSETSQTIEKLSNNCSKPSGLLKNGAKIGENRSISKENVKSYKTSCASNWREPATMTEKLIEERRKLPNQLPNSHKDAVQYLSMERENQLFWIRSEIQHLNNLKELLEKQEELKQGMNSLKSKPKSTGKVVLNDKNRKRTGGIKLESSSRNKSRVKKDEKDYFSKKTKHDSSLGAWLEKTAAESRINVISSAVSSDGTDDWASHHYKSENHENIRSCLRNRSKLEKREGKSMLLQEQRRSNKSSKNIFGEKPSESSYKRHPSTHDQLTASSKVIEGANKNNGQEKVMDTDEVQTTNPGQPVYCCKLKQNLKCQCSCQGHCDEKGAGINKDSKRDNRLPIGYYITFEPPSQEHNKCNCKQQLLEEVRISVPMSEPKQKSLQQNRRMTASCTVKKTGSFKPKSSEKKVIRVSSDLSGSETEHITSHSNDGVDTDKPHRGNPSFQGATGMLQYYLLQNRPLYVSRAEDRRHCIAQMQYLRELREHSKRRLLSLTEPSINTTTPPFGAVRRVFSQQTMRSQTERKYRQLSEVRQRQQDTKRKECYRTNRLMAEIFKKKLQKRVLKGEVNLSNSVSVISSI